VLVTHDDRIVSYARKTGVAKIAPCSGLAPVVRSLVAGAHTTSAVNMINANPMQKNAEPHVSSAVGRRGDMTPDSFAAGWFAAPCRAFTCSSRTARSFESTA
jgi:hypothetical protein